MVVTRSQTGLVQSSSQAQSSDCAPAATSVEVCSTTKIDPNSKSNRTPSISDTRSSRSSTTITARKLAAEAQHARHLAQLEIAAVQKQVELEREAAEIEYRAQLAAIEADDCNLSHHSSHRSEKSRTSSVEQWLCNSAPPKQNVDNSLMHKCEVGPNNISVCSQDFTAGSNVAITTNVAVRSPTLLPQADFCRGDGAATTNVRKQVNDSVGVTKLVDALQILTRNNGSNNKNIIALPVFDGRSPLDWLMFKRAFQDTASMFSDTENLARLNQALRGVARESVSMLIVMAQQARDVIDALDCRFGKPEQIVLQEVNAIRALPRLGPDVKDLNIFATRVRNCVQVVKLLDHTDYIRSPELFGALLGKFSPLLRSRWFDFAESHQSGLVTSLGQARVEMLSNFLNREVELIMKFGAVAEASAPPPQHRAHTVSESDINYSDTKTGAIPKNSGSKFSKSVNHENSCLHCKQEHELSSCQKFKSLTIEDKWRFIKENKICHRCLKKVRHNFKFCSKNKAGCTLGDCKGKHHTLLHCEKFISSAYVNEHIPVPARGTEPVPSTSVNTEQVAINTAATMVDPSLRPLLKVVAVTICGPTGTVDTFALLDDGATATFIDSDIASRIGAKGPQGRIHLDCIGGLSKNSTVRYVDFEIKGRYSSKSFSIQGARSIKNLGLLTQSAARDNLSAYAHLADLKDELYYDEAKPMLVIGLDNWHLITASEIRKGTKSQPVAIRTPLGWVLFGFSSSITRPVDHAYHVSLRDYNDPRHELEALIKDQYRLDAIGITKYEPQSSNNQRALAILDRTAQRLPSGRFQVGLLWKADKLKVPDSFPLAFSRFRSLERKMSKDPDYAARYRHNIHDIITKGYAENCTGLPPKSVCWYLPHFGVVNPNKPAKLRVVHDAAASVQGVSLNSLLLTGPDFLQPLLGILMRFREGRIALTADVKEMFPQVKIREQDQDAQRFLWRDDPAEPIKIYRMSSMMFGACSSPSTAIYIMNRNASEFRDEFPEAVHAIMSDTYMDDYIGSVDDSVEQAARLAADIVKIHKRGGFEMRGWISNKPGALSQLPKELLSTPSPSDHSIDLGRPTFARTLGLNWHPILDTIGFNTGIKDTFVGGFTKRHVLAQVMRIYDPLGILAPIVIRGRILFQNLWRKSLEWDEVLLEADQLVWQEWFDSLKSLLNLQVPRCYNLSGYIDIELHVFCDASELAHVAVAYWRFILANGEIKLALIASKARVSPLKPVSIPRLELQGALIATRLATTICEAHRSKPSRRFFWCDSMTVLGWLRNDARNYKPFVAHRIGEIIETSSLNEWRWVPSEHNVADDATRGKCNIESRWITGPSFLLTPASEWPIEPQVTGTATLGQEELKPLHRHHALSEQSSQPIESINFINLQQIPLPVVANISHFSSWIRLVRATARTHRFIAAIFKKRGHTFQNFWVQDICFDLNDSNSRPATASAPLDANDIIRAERHIFGWSQLNTFGEELLCLRRGQLIPRKSRLTTLTPVLKCGLLHLAGRTSAVITKQPIILDAKDPAVRLLIQHYHCKFAHANTETVINELRQHFWILGLRNAVRSVRHDCQMCKLLKAPVLQPPMADLPDARLCHNRRPFSFIGVDYFGPLAVAVGRRQEKRWVALFTCLVTRAIHLEIVASLSADSAIMCLRRLIARRGTPSAIYSDNGTAFVGANRQLRILYDAAVSQFAADQKIVWHFIPPSAPFMGGAWERLVRSVKTALKVTLRERAPREEVLATVLAEAEAIVNTRPLTHVSPDADYPEALTPNHFLIGNSSGYQFPHEDLSDAALVGRSSWRKALRLADHFWRRWVSEYLPTLAPRRVPGIDVAVKIGDPVLIGDGDLPRGTWPRGVISALFPGRDGVVRVVDVRTPGGILRRPLRKLVLL